MGRVYLIQDLQFLILLILLGEQRMNTVFNFEVDNLFINTECAIFSLNKVLKHSEPGRKLDQFTYRLFPQIELCIVDTLQEYLTYRKLKVDWSIKELFITFKAPYHEVSMDTLRTWIHSVPPTHLPHTKFRGELGFLNFRFFCEVKIFLISGELSCEEGGYISLWRSVHSPSLFSF